MTREHGRAAASRAPHFPVLLLAVLAGLFAMHGLGPHDGDHSAGHVPTVLALVTETDGHVGHERHGRTAADPDPGEQHDDEGGSGLGECLALLGMLVALAIGAVLAARPHQPILTLRRVRSRLGLGGRPPDPPCLHRLSILRC